MMMLMMTLTTAHAHKCTRHTEGQRPKRVQVCKESHTLEQVINLLADHSIHRVFVVDDAKKPIGVITLKDVLLEILSP